MNGEMIENAIRTGKIEEEEHTKKSNYRRRDNEVINTCVYNVGYTKQLTVGQPKAATSNVQNSSKKGSSQRTKAEDMEFTPIPMSYGELYKNLYNAHVVSPFYIKPIQPPYPKWYDADAHCDHHAGVTGHSIENCPAFKRLVEKIIKMGVVRFDDSAGSSTSENPLPVHAESGANAIVEGNKKIKTTMEDVKTLLRWVWKKMIEMGMLQKIAGNVKETSNDCCPYHGKKDHDIQNCAEFKTLIQQLVDNKELEFFEERLVEEAYICTSEYRNKNLEDNYPVIVISGPRKYGKGESSQAKVTIEKPVPFPYHDSRKVPWKYNCEVSIQGEEALKTTSKDVNDVGFFTRSGRRYVPKEAEDPKEKAPVNVEPESLVNEPVKEEEKLKFIFDGRLVTVNAEEDIIASITSEAPYIETDEKAEECSFRSFEFVNATFIPEGSHIPTPRLSNATRVGIKLTIGR
ncbi:hypothetical protein HRI_001715400 [Hibiscus trionum]|nr:hypothetical protein HRI_001715400 [Hibiscus trionum]